MKNNDNDKKIKYFLYARKSSENEDRQVQSIDDQVNRLKQLARDLNLDIKKIYTEAKSAKKPNNRPIFDEMMERIENGEANGILCWQINRLSRNPIDSGKI
ncbi:MAG TPA: recombinase family protein, partial [Candidatus Moranbacteria bacterium]|nr:recombinase family protein [Candidatus Moranbacteria bacterium]